MAGRKKVLGHTRTMSKGEDEGLPTKIVTCRTNVESES